MAMDVLEKLNRRFSGWHEKLFGHIGQRDLRPQDILRRIVTEMESTRRKGLDGYLYVPNVYTLQVAVGSEDERQYLRTFLGAEELVNAVAQEIEGRGYRVKGTLLFTVEEVAPAVLEQRIRVLCRFDPDAVATQSPTIMPVAPAYTPPASAPNPVYNSTDRDDEEPGTVAAITPAVATLQVMRADGSLKLSVPVTLAGVKIGRSRRSGNDVVIDDDPQVSKRHARIAYEQGRFVLYDEGSTNGTMLHNTRIPVNQPVVINFNENFRIGENLLCLRQNGEGSAPMQSPSPHSMVAPPIVAPVVSGANNQVIYRLLAGDGTIYTLASEMIVGRGVTEDIVLNGNGVSSRHARLTVRGVALYVEDLATPGGTFVNGERIPANFPVALYNEDQITFGEVLLRVERSR